MRRVQKEKHHLAMLSPTHFKRGNFKLFDRRFGASIHNLKLLKKHAVTKIKVQRKGG